MSFFPSVLRPALLALATLAFVPSPSITVTVAGVTAMTVMTNSQAEAGRPKVRDHRTRRCPPNAGGPGCTSR